MLQIVAFLAILVSTFETNCPLIFHDSYCSDCDTQLKECIKCVDSSTFEEGSGFCHTYSKTFQKNEQPNTFNNAYYNRTRDRVQMLDPFCIIKDVESLASSNSSICGTCAKFKEGSNAQRYVSGKYLICHKTLISLFPKTEDTKECHATCAYSAQGRYPNNGKCVSCDNNCFNCLDFNKCQECSYTKKRFSGSVTPINFLTKSTSGQINPSTDCKENRDSNFTFDYYVTPSSSHNTYWTDLNDVFYDIYTKIGNYTSGKINIYLLKSGSNNLVHYLLDNNPAGNSRLNGGGSYNLRDGNPFIVRLSDRTQTEIKISPRYCTDDITSIEGCLNEAEKPIIKWKSEVAHIFVTYKVTLTNIILDGADMILSLIDSSTSEGVAASTCRNAKQECCTDPSFNEFGCSPASISYDDWSLEETQETTNRTRKYGIFVFQYITDSPNLHIPELLIENCDIKNFLYSKYHTSFVEFDIYGGKLIIKNSSFDRFFFPHGLISNSHHLIDRNYDPMTSSFTHITCRKIDPTHKGDCYSISLENSNFTNYNPLKTSIKNIAYKNVIEGAVMTLHNFDGLITINRCTFQNIFSFSPLGKIGESSQVCSPFDFENSEGFKDMFQASHDIITTSKYKIFFDKHFRKYYQAPNTQNLPTTAVIHLRNVTKGLIVHDSTFNQIYSVAGGSIFIHGFNNTYKSPIMITKNRFTNNFVQLFALNILIYKEMPDIPNLNCTGILISNNEFLNNYGCVNTLGNIAIACEPTITNSFPGYSDKTFDQYYTGYSSATSHEHTETIGAKRNFVRYMEEFAQSVSNSYNHPIEPDISFNSNSINISNNVIIKNYAILSNGFYCQGVMEIIIENNLFKENSIPTSKTYSDPEFIWNVLSINAIDPLIESSDNNIMRESCPVIIRHCNRINIRNNIFDKNSQGFRGGDYHIAQAITLASIIGREPVLIENCTFTNHTGLSDSIVDINYDLGYYDYATTAMITFNYWESLEVESTNITENLFTVRSCSFMNNYFSNDNGGGADTKFIYYVDKNNGMFRPGAAYVYKFPFAYLLKYFLDDEITAMSVTKEMRNMGANDPTKLKSYFRNPFVSIQKAFVTNSTFERGICAFNNFFFAHFEIKESNFTNNVVEEEDSMGKCAALICVFQNQIYLRWGATPQIFVNKIIFENTTGMDIYGQDVYDQQVSVALTPFYRFIVEDVISDGAKASLYSPIYIYYGNFISFRRITYRNYAGPYGLTNLEYVTSSELQNLTFYASSFQAYDVLTFYRSSNISISIDYYGNSSEPNPDQILFQLYESYNIKFKNCTFRDINVSLIFKVEQYSSLYIESSTFLNCSLQQTLSWIVSSSIIEFQKCRFENITFGSAALAGIALLDSSSFSLKNSRVLSLTGPNSLILSANMSESTIQDTVIERCIAKKANALITTILGSLIMNNNRFSKNIGQDQVMFYAILTYTYQISNCLFDSNSAQKNHKLFSLTQLANGAIFTSCEFIDPYSDPNFDVDDQNNQYQYTSSFLNIFNADLTLNNCTFLGGINSKGAIYLLAEDYTLTVTDSKFHNNIGSVGSIGGIASLVIENTIFYGNTHTIVMTGGKTARLNNVKFQEEMSLSISLKNIPVVELNQVLFDGIADLSLKINNIVYSNLQQKSRGVQIFLANQIQIKSSIFKNLNFVKEGVCGGGLNICNPEASFPLESSLSILNSTFENITSNQGGAICIQDLGNNRLAAEIENTIINGCSAQSGGGIFYNSFDNAEDVSTPDYLKILGSTQIINNNAGNETFGAGGGIYYQGKRPIVDSSVLFKGNLAHYGNNWASYPVTIQIITNPDPIILREIEIKKQLLEYGTKSVNTTSSKNSRILSSNSKVELRKHISKERNLEENYGIHLNSGAVPDPPPVVGMYDIDNQLVWGWNEGLFLVFDFDLKLCRTLKMIIGSSSVVRQAPTTFYATNGYFALYPLQLINTPGTSVAINLTTSVTIQSGSQAKTIPINIASKIYFRECYRGERLTDTRECYACPPGQYILDPDFQGMCERCPENLNCLGGGDIGPKTGYWRFDGWKSQAILCPNPQSCLGNLLAGNDTRNLFCKEKKNTTFCYTGFCDEGYEGNVCSDCIDGYAKSANFCVPCASNVLLYVILVVAVIVAIFFIIFTVRNALKVKEATKLNKPKTSILIKIFLNYVQLVSIVASFQFQWPDQVKTMFDVQEKVASGPSQAFSVDCLFPSQSGSNRTFFSKLLLISLSPLAVIIVGTIVWLLIFLLKKAHFDMKLFKSNITTTYVVIIFILHSTLVQNSLLAFKCRNIGDTEDEKYYLERDLEVECWDNTHLFWVFVCALPAFIIWGIGTPIFAYALLRRNIGLHENVEFKSKYGFLYDGYKKNKYYWEFMILYRKIAMIIISIFMMTLGVKVQSLCVLGVCFISYILHIYGLPFEDQALNYMERRALINATITLYLGIFYVTGGISIVVNWIMLVVIIVLNIYFFVTWLKALIQEFIKERKALVAQKQLQKLPTQLKPQIKSNDSLLSPAEDILGLSDILSNEEASPPKKIV